MLVLEWIKKTNSKCPCPKCYTRESLHTQLEAQAL